MLAVHGIWAYGALFLWAEDADGPAAGQPRPGRPSRAPRPHPFAAAADTIAAAVAEHVGPVADLVLKAVDDELTLWLPATADGPLASPELIRAPEIKPGAGTRRSALSAWRVPALTFEPAVALDLLGVLGESRAHGGQAVQGGSVRYLAALAQLAGDLAARGRVLPALAVGGDVRAAGASGAGADGGYAARWRPALSGADAQRARELAVAMPPLCRATTACGEPSALVLIDALDALTDAAARASLNGQPGFALLAARRGRRPARIPVAERWAVALTSMNPQVAVLTPEDEAEAAALEADLAAWRRAVQVPAGPVRTCFRLVEPPPTEALPDSASGPAAAGTASAPGKAGGAGKAGAAAELSWAVELALQSTDDPSLLLPAPDVWSGVSVGGWAAAGIRHPEEELLAGLGRASRLFPELDHELRSAAPASVTLDTEGALEFLRQTGPLLSGAGFGVLLPDWARRARLGIKITTRSRQAAGAGSAAEPKFNMADLVDFRYDLALGDQELDADDLAELARLKIPLVRLRGQWVELDDRHLQAALKFLQRDRTGTMSAADAMLAGLRGVDEADGDLPVVGVDADGWLGDLLSGHADQRLAPAGTPASFRGELRPYQERGLAWLSFLGSLGLGGILADDMGLGKTVELLSLLSKDGMSDSGPTAPTLLICPMSLVGNWEREAERFTPDLRVHVHHGAGRLAGPEFADAAGAADLVITTYGMVTRDRDALSEIRWRRVVCDEAQNIKNSATRQAQAVRSLPAGSRIALTGTPVENRLAELWSIMEFTSPGLLGPAERFRTSYAVPIERGGDAEATARLKRITGPFILRRLKTDRAIISDLPDKLEMKVWCNLTPEQASLYQATVTDMLAKIEAAPDGIERRGLVLATMAKLKQACNHPAHLLGDGSRLDGRSGKLARLEEICDEVIAGGEKALCFTQYAEFGRMLQPYLAARLGYPVLYLHGGTPKRQRDALVSRFQAETDPSVFILSLKAGGTGLNLTAANHVIHIDRWWNPAVEDQATDRAFRIGQRKDVQVRKFVCVGTVEERIDAMIEEKKALAERIVGTGEGWLTEMSVAELRKVIALSPEAVSD
jgi:SNF2-related domain/SNF2 Helicase protein/Helicase conserved C-terminal domain